ncbi:MAG: hypothetical protein IPP29_24000 [Bacteroidetes bacterium]|nr:hypothetical protein [Bacteroidota bacterium]
MSLNNGLGAVTQKNIQLYSQVGNDCLTAIKHGNGRDWWLIFRSALFPNDTNDNFYLYLIDSNGINPPIIEHAGSFNYGSEAGIKFNSTGNQFARLMWYGVIELFDFDRCTGSIQFNKLIEYQPVDSSPYNYYFFSAFSPSGRFLYITEWDKKTYLHQYDLQAANVTMSKVTVDSFSFPKYTGGGLKLAPDGKIYMSSLYTPTGSQYYPYSDTTYNMYNMNLSVINEPDSAGLACNFTKYSYYLGGNRTYVCLPNNPDYDLPGDSGCSNVSIPPAPQRGDQQIHTTYISAWEKLFVNAQNLKGKDAAITIYDAAGKEKFARASPVKSLGLFGIFYT